MTNTPNSFLYDLKGIMFGLQIGGLLPLYDIKSPYKLIMPSRKKLLLCYGIQCVLCATVLYNAYTLLISGSEQLFYSYRETDNGNNLLEILLGLITYVIMSYFSITRNHKLMDILNEIMKVIKELEEQHDNGCIARKKPHNDICFAYMSMIIVWIIQLYIGILKIVAVQDTLLMSTCIQITAYGLQNILSSGFTVLIATLIHVLSKMFQAINDIIYKYTYKVQQQQQEATFKDKFSNDCQFVFRLHNNLLCILQSIESFCAPMMLIHMGYAFFAITSNMLSIVVQIKAHPNISYILFQLGIATLLGHILLLVLISYCIQKCLTKANDIGQLFAKVYIEIDDKNTSCNYVSLNTKFQCIIDKFLMKRINQPAQFTVYRFFNIDSSTLFKIFSAVTTFLVVMIQFRQMENL